MFSEVGLCQDLSMKKSTLLFSHRPFWAKRLLPSPVLPMSRDEMDQLGWDSCDVILVTGDAYVDHPSFGMALIGRLLEEHGFRVGIIAQPDWSSAEAFQQLGRPNLYFGVTAGNMDSMVNRYTADRRIRSDDAYSPDGVGGKRPDRSVLVYSQRCREAYRDVPIVIGGIEASLRRLAHYDYWSDKVRRSLLFDSKADLLLYGNAERSIVELTHRLAKGESIESIRDLRGSAWATSQIDEHWIELDYLNPDFMPSSKGKREDMVVRIPSYEMVKSDPQLYAHASRMFHLETNPDNARPVVQNHGDRDLWVNPPPIPLSTKELDRVFELPYTRKPHPAYSDARIPAYEMIRFSVNIMRGCFGGCTFCSITEHEGRIIQNRSEASIVREVEAIRDLTPGFTGNISDLGGPTANMYRLKCKDPKVESQCRKLSCVYPEICSYMSTDQMPLVSLYRAVRGTEGIKRVFIASGLRYDIAVKTPEYVKELVTHHVGGYLKIAPEHTEVGPLSIMMKPGIAVYEQFKQMFEHYSREAGKEQYLIPYFISSHPGTTHQDMVKLALWLKRNNFRLDQVQNFLPTPMTIAAAIYYSGLNTLKRVGRDAQHVDTPRGGRARRIQKALLRYHDATNWPLLREVLKDLGLSELIGNSKRHLIPTWQPDGQKKPSHQKDSPSKNRIKQQKSPNQKASSAHHPSRQKKRRQ